MNLEFAHLQENIEACEAQITGSAAVLDQMQQCLAERFAIKRIADETGVSERAVKLFSDIAKEFMLTHGSAIEAKAHTEPNAPRWPLCVATDDERANGRLAWVPGL